MFRIPSRLAAQAAGKFGLVPTLLVALALPSFSATPGPPKTGDDLLKLINGAPDGSTISLKGTYTAAVGTTYLVSRRLNIAGNSSALVNIRLIFLADFSLSDLTILEQDCTFHSSAPAACPAASSMITIGLQGYSIGSATLTNVSLQYTRAYTGIAFGLGPVQNVTINGFSIVDNELSGITGLSGTHIAISNGTIVGGTQKNVDDGIALYSAYGPLTDVSVQNVQAQDTFDLVGIGTLMYYPISNIRVTGNQCTRTAVCLYVKAGSQSPVPSGFTSYSTLSNVTISNITDSDTGGSRYLSSVWLVGTGGAVVNGLWIDRVTATARAAAIPSARIRLFTDSTSKLTNIQLSNFTIGDPPPTRPNQTVGFTATQGINFQDLGFQNISGVTITGVNIDSATSYAIDSSGAHVASLTIANSLFTHMNLANPGAPLFFIPYSYLLNSLLVP